MSAAASSSELDSLATQETGDERDPSRMLLDLISLQAATRAAADKAAKARKGYETQREENQVLLEYVDNLISVVSPTAPEDLLPR